MTKLTPIRSRDLGEDEPDEAPAQGQSSAAETLNDFGTKMLMLGLGALSKRAFISLMNLFALITAASAFYIWVIALPEVSVLKIVAASIYSMFVLVLNVIIGRRA